MVQHFTIKEPVFDTVAYIVLGADPDEVNAYCEKKLKVRGTSDWIGQQECYGLHIDLANHSHIIWFPEMPSVGTIVHESVHCLIHHMVALGITKADEDTEEIQAYYLQWLVESIIKGLGKLKSRKHKKRHKQYLDEQYGRLENVDD